MSRNTLPEPQLDSASYGPYSMYVMWCEVMQNHTWPTYYYMHILSLGRAGYSKHFTCHMSHVTCHVSCVTFVTCITCLLSFVMCWLYFYYAPSPAERSEAMRGGFIFSLEIWFLCTFLVRTMPVLLRKKNYLKLRRASRLCIRGPRRGKSISRKSQAIPAQSV